MSILSQSPLEEMVITLLNTPWTRDWSRFCDRTLAVKSTKNARAKKKKNLVKNKNTFYIFLLVMPKYKGKQNFSFLSFPKVGRVKSNECREKEREKSESQC